MPAPTADMVRMRSVESAPNCARVRQMLASTCQSGHGEGSAQAHHYKAEYA